MRLPRDVSGEVLARILRKLGYLTTRQTGSHIRLTTQEHGEHHVTVPNHNPIRIGTLANILSDVGAHIEQSRDEIAERLFG